MPSSSSNIKLTLDWTGILLILLIPALFLLECNSNEKSSKKIVTIDDVKYKVDTTVQYITYKPYSFIKNKTKDEFYTFIIKYDTIYEKIDTPEIIKNYFSKVLIIDTLQFEDSLGYVIVKDTIFKNRLFFRNYNAKINQKEIHDTTWLAPIPTNKFYLGVTGGVSKTLLPNTFGLSFLYQNQNDKIYGIGLGLQNGVIIHPYINGSIYWKLKLKKDASKRK